MKKTLINQSIIFLNLFFLNSAIAEQSFSLVSYQNVAKTYSVEAVVEAVKQSTISAQTSGKITQINVDIGDQIKKGQILAKIDPIEINQALNVNQGQIAQAQASVENAKNYYNRINKLVDEKFMSPANLDKALADYKTALAQLKTAQASQGQTTVSKNFTIISAPYDGIISSKLIQVGELATPSRPILTFFDPKDLRVIVNIPQYSMQKIQTQIPAKIQFSNLNEMVTADKITVVPSADKNTHVTTIRLDFPNSTTLNGIYPGMFAKAFFTMGYEKKLVIPTKSILKRSELTAVYVLPTLSNQSLKLRQIRIGETFNNGELTEVLAGLNPNEKILNH